MWVRLTPIQQAPAVPASHSSAFFSVHFHMLGVSYEWSHTCTGLLCQASSLSISVQVHLCCWIECVEYYLPLCSQKQTQLLADIHVPLGPFPFPEG